MEKWPWSWDEGIKRKEKRERQAFYRTQMKVFLLYVHGAGLHEVSLDQGEAEPMKASILGPSQLPTAA